MEGSTTQKISSSDEKRILVLSASSKHDDGLSYGISPSQSCGSPRVYRYAHFSLVDLSLGKLVPKFLPSMLQFVRPSTMLVLDSSLYVFGGRPADSEQPCHLELLSHPPESHQKVFVGGSRLRLDMDADGWCPVQKPIGHTYYPKCVSLLGKMYFFGSRLDIPEVLDPSVGVWKPLTVPPDLVGCVLLYNPLPDPSNDRIILHLGEGNLPSPSIYAFTPTDGGTWELITRYSDQWFEVAAIIDDVVYFNSKDFLGVLCAVHIESGERLNVHWASKVEKGLNMNKTRMKFDALFPLGDKILCLACWSFADMPAETDPACSVYFLKFRVERSGSTVILIPLSSQSFVLPATCDVMMFLPL